MDFKGWISNYEQLEDLANKGIRIELSKHQGVPSDLMDDIRQDVLLKLLKMDTSKLDLENERDQGYIVQIAINQTLDVLKKYYESQGKGKQVPTARYYADVVPIIRNLKSKGMTLQQIANELDASGKTTRQGASWTPHAVRMVLGHMGELPRYEDKQVFLNYIMPIVKDMSDRGMSLYAIAKNLNDQEITTRQGKKWSAMQVKRLLQGS